MGVKPQRQRRCHHFGDLFLDGGRLRATTIRMGRLSYDMLSVLVGAAPNRVT